MNIFWREMKSHRKSLIFWSIGVFLMVVSGMGKYDAYSSQGQSINVLIADIPKSLKAVMGFSNVDVSKISGYYSVLFVYILLMATIHAAMLGANIIAKEERDKTAEFLFTKPILRSTVITAKLLAAVVNILIFNLITLISLIAFMGKYNRNGEAINGDIVLTMSGMLILQILFMVVGSAIASVKKNPKTVASLATGILLSSYLLSIAIDLNENIDFLKYITPFKYFEAEMVILDGGLDLINFLISVVVIAVLAFVTYVFFDKRDLNV